MIYYKEYPKPVTNEFTNQDFYERLLKGYNELKAEKDTIVLDEGTDKERCLVNISHLDEFVITSIARADFKSIGFDASELTDGDMHCIASKMSDSYVGNGFWIDLRFFAEEYNLPRIEEE